MPGSGAARWELCMPVVANEWVSWMMLSTCRAWNRTEYYTRMQDRHQDVQARPQLSRQAANHQIGGKATRQCEESLTFNV